MDFVKYLFQNEVQSPSMSMVQIDEVAMFFVARVST